METKKLADLKGSEKLKIEAAVLEIMETKNFALDKDFGITESTEDPNNWVMAFQNKKCKLEELVNAKQILGQKFSVEITSKSKENFLFRVEAPSEEFIRLGFNLKPLSQGQPSMPAQQSSTGSSQQPFRTPNGNSSTVYQNK